MHARVLSNWLYALNTSGLAAIIALVTTGRVTGSILHMSTILFLISLALCILATGLEWLRFTLYLPKIQTHFNDFVMEKSDYDSFVSSSKEHKAWFWSVTILKFIGYLCWLGAVIVLIRQLQIF